MSSARIPVSYGAAALYGFGLEKLLASFERPTSDPAELILACEDAQIEREEREAETFPVDAND